ncbi:MAG: GTP-binding protein [bacterium]|nr:GTP-binding protein [bacterium]
MAVVRAVSRAVPLNVVTGFLGAGKTTAIRYLLEHGRQDERWAVLVNEFGKIGIDQAVLADAENSGGITVREVPGGCLCCTNHLPLQVALSQLLSRVRPDRVLIEPTGLGHPARLLDALREAHWRDALEVRATITLVDARELADARVLTHETFRAQIEAADVLVFSKNDVLGESERERAREFSAGLVPPKAHVHFMAGGQLPREWLDLPARSQALRRSLLHRPPAAGVPVETEDREPPYHYSEVLAGVALAGWVFPRDWVFAHDALLGVLFGIREAMRVKGVFHTDKGWIFFNATRHETAVNSEPSRADSRLEVIMAQAQDWAALEAALLSCRQEPV